MQKLNLALERASSFPILTFVALLIIGIICWRDEMRFARYFIAILLLLLRGRFLDGLAEIRTDPARSLWLLRASDEAFEIARRK